MVNYSVLKGYDRYFLGIVILYLLSNIPHEIGHVLAARFFGYEVKGMFWSLPGSSYVVISNVYDPINYLIIRLSGGFFSALTMYALMKVLRDRALVKAARSCLLYCLLIGLSEGFLMNLYNVNVLFSLALLYGSVGISLGIDYLRDDYKFY